MATRSNIAAKLANGTVGIIYCHWDGYCEPDCGVGNTLHQHYREQAKIDQLIALGDLSSLEASIDCPDGHSYENKVDGHTVAFTRDRGENCPATFEKNVTNAYRAVGGGQQCNYYWNGSDWYVRRNANAWYLVSEYLQLQQDGRDPSLAKLYTTNEVEEAA